MTVCSRNVEMIPYYYHDISLFVYLKDLITNVSRNNPEVECSPNKLSRPPRFQSPLHGAFLNLSPRGGENGDFLEGQMVVSSTLKFSLCRE